MCYESNKAWHGPGVGLGVVLVVLTLLASERAGQWVEPPVAPNSLAQEASRKLARLSSDVGAGGSSEGAQSGSEMPDGLYVVIDTHTNRLYGRTTDSVLFSMLCSTGTGAELEDSTSARRWRFDTPRGIFHVTQMAPDPVWRKPDWAFIEEGEPIPDSATARLDTESLGDFSIGFGDGYYIHGTIYERLIGVAVTHGCIRLASHDLEQLYARVTIGTPIVIF